MKLLSLIVPVLNEEESIPLFYEAVQEVLRDEPYELEILFVDDGSTDKTLEIIEELHARDPRVRGISFSRNFGKELALAAGLQAARGDAVVPMDVDLQDPPALLKQFLRLWEQGYETVIGVRSRRDADSWAKRVSAGLFYRLFSRLTKGRIVPNAGDYRLMDRVVVDALNALPERVRFTKGLYGWVGFRSAIVEYERPARVAGSSKWPGWSCGILRWMASLPSVRCRCACGAIWGWPWPWQAFPMPDILFSRRWSGEWMCRAMRR